MDNLTELSIYTLPTQAPTSDSHILNQLFLEIKRLREEVCHLWEDRDRDYSEIQALRNENIELKAKIATLEHNIDQSFEAIARDQAIDRKRLSALENVPSQAIPQALSQGKKTKNRIERLKLILKNSRGSRTFQQLQDDLEISPSQFSKLIAAIDKRIFETFRREHGKHGEKVLRLRARIMDPI